MGTRLNKRLRPSYCPPRNVPVHECTLGVIAPYPDVQFEEIDPCEVS